MAIHTPVVFETLFLQERTRQNLHTCNISESLQIVQYPRKNIKIFGAREVLPLTERLAWAGGIRHFNISEVLTFVEALHPRVLVYDVGDTISFTEYLTRLTIGHHLNLAETLTFVLVHLVHEILDLQETLTFKASHRKIVSETLALVEGASAILVNVKTGYTDICQVCPNVASPLKKEVPTGAINGTNVNFVISQTPTIASSLMVFVNDAIVTGYTFVGTTITFNVPPQTGNTLYVYYLIG